MPVDGLPNPTLHRLCRRCGRWHHLHEGSYIQPAASGPVSWLHHSYRRHTDPQAGLRFVCSACQAPRSPSSRQRLLGGLAGLAAGGLLAWWLYASGMLDDILSGLFSPGRLPGG